MKIAPITRGTPGGDAVHCAAYRGGRDLWNERTGDLHKWSFRADVREASVILPRALASDPRYAWAKDPYRLWNTAEFAERRCDSRVAREYMMILPSELSPVQRREAVYRYAQALADRYGNAIDVALHDAREGRARHPHAHLLATTREIGPRGLLAKTDAELAGDGRRARGLTNTYQEEQGRSRELWEGMLFAALREAHLPARIYETLYRDRDAGETTSQYHSRLVREGYALAAQRLADHRDGALTPSERLHVLKKKQEIERYQASRPSLRRQRWNAHAGLLAEPLSEGSFARAHVARGLEFGR